MCVRFLVLTKDMSGGRGGPKTGKYFCYNYSLDLNEHERICPLSSRILQKRSCIFKYDVFLKSVFVVFYEIVLKRKYA